MVHRFFATRLPLAAAALLSAALSGGAQANDSTGFMGTHGLTLTRTEAIEIVSEDLLVGSHQIRVGYVFRNVTDTPITTTVVFPFPGIDMSAGATAANWNFPADGPREFLDFEVSVNGTPVPFEIERKAFFRGRDVTAEIDKAGLLKVAPWVAGTYPEQMSGTSPAVLARLKSAGLVAEGEDSETDPQWTIVLKAYWSQTFPVGTTLRVTHRYRPFVGTALIGLPSEVDGRTPQARLQGGGPQDSDRYCIDAATRRGLKSLDRKPGAQAYGFSTEEIEYILLTARNWRGPIGQFRLTIDKGDPDNILSLCWPGLKKVGPTSFRFEAANWTPDRDLKLIIFRAPENSDGQ